MGLISGQEKKGVILVLLSAVIWGAFPIAVSKGVEQIPPVTFAAISTLIASLAGFFYAVARNKLKEVKRTEAYKPLLMITVFTIIIPYILFFWGASMTSATNATILLLSEIIFTALVTPLMGEKTSIYKILGAAGVFFGALFILYNGTLTLNTGDLIIIASTMSYPIGNFYSKKALHAVDPSIIIFVRFLLGGACILLIARLVEPSVDIAQVLVDHWGLLLFNGVVLLGVTKVLWYEAFKRIDISKAISLAMTFPIFSLAILMIWFDEIPTLYQCIGIVLMAVGVYFTIKRKSVDPAKTKYNTV